MYGLLQGITYQELRTNAAVLRDAQKADETNCIGNGIKGKSVLSVDLVKGVPVDYMHCVLEGVTKWMLEKWVNSSSHRCACYIGRSILHTILVELRAVFQSIVNIGKLASSEIGFCTFHFHF